MDPVWSPDGSEIVFVSSQPYTGPDVIYADGSCLACEVPGPWVGSEPAFWNRKVGPGFLPDGRLAVSVHPVHGNLIGLQVGAVNTDGSGFQPFEVSGSWQQQAWSATGQLAAVRLVRRRSEVFVIDPGSGSARQLTRDGASAPNWSPDGRRLAVVHDGWIELIGSGGGQVRRLTRGGAPAWAPNGKELAFVGAHDRLFVISAGGGTPRPVGHIRALSVDWQPVTTTSPPICQAPASASVLAASPDATITIDRTPGGEFSVLGCLTSDGRERVLESPNAAAIEGEPGLGSVVVAGDYAALVNEASNLHYGYGRSIATLAVFDLRTGAMMDRSVIEFGGGVLASSFGESAICPEGDLSCGIDQLVLGPDGVSAAHTLGTVPGSSCGEQIVANDDTGKHILDSITTSGSCSIPPAPELSQLTLSGDTLTWSHAGTAESAQLN
jgi:hypothetical protein